MHDPRHRFLPPGLKRLAEASAAAASAAQQEQANPPAAASPPAPAPDTHIADPNPPAPPADDFRAAVGVEGGMVCLRFSRPVDLVRLKPKDARQFAELMRQASYRARG